MRGAQAAFQHLTWAVMVVGFLVMICIIMLAALTWHMFGRHPKYEARYDAADVVWTSTASGSGTCVGYFPDGTVLVTNKPEFVIQNGEAMLDPDLPSPHAVVAEWDRLASHRFLGNASNGMQCAQVIGSIGGAEVYCGRYRGDAIHEEQR